MLRAKSLQRSPTVGDFYGTGIEIWARFGRMADFPAFIVGPLHSSLFENSQFMPNFLGFKYRMIIVNAVVVFGPHQ